MMSWEQRELKPSAGLWGFFFFFLKQKKKTQRCFRLRDLSVKHVPLNHRITLHPTFNPYVLCSNQESVGCRWSLNFFIYNWSNIDINHCTAGLKRSVQYLKTTMRLITSVEVQTAVNHQLCCDNAAAVTTFHCYLPTGILVINLQPPSSQLF